MKRLALVLLASLALASPAAAKELQSVSICGVSSCTTYEDEKTATLLAHMGESSGRAAAPGAYYVVTFTGDAQGEQFGWKSFYVPGAELWASFDDMYGLVRWSTASPSAARVLDAATRGLEPFPAPSIEAVRIDGKPIGGDPQGYLTLFTAEASRPAPEPSKYDWVPVDLVASAATPWTMSERDLMFSPSAGAIERVGVRIPLEPELAGAVAAGDTLPIDGDEFAWLTLVLAFGGVLVVILLALAGQRLGRKPEVSRASTA